MEKIGNIQKREIFYVQMRNNKNWLNKLPNKNWIAFTIANKEDFELVPKMVEICVKRNVCYSCSAGEYARMTEDFFDEEIVWNDLKQNDKEGNYYMTTSHTDFE